MTSAVSMLTGTHMYSLVWSGVLKYKSVISMHINLALFMEFVLLNRILAVAMLALGADLLPS